MKKQQGGTRQTLLLHFGSCAAEVPAGIALLWCCWWSGQDSELPLQLTQVPSRYIFPLQTFFWGGSREEHVVLKPAVSFIWIHSHTDKTVFIWARSLNQATLASSRRAEYLCHHPPFSLSFWGHKIDTISEGFLNKQAAQALGSHP